nr:hypothetical protein [Tanacetum cinerariifolium]
MTIDVSLAAALSKLALKRKHDEDVISVLDPVVFETMNIHLQSPVTDSEIHKATKQLGGLKASGQTVNFEKSSDFFSPNTTSSLRDDICGNLHVHQMDSKAKYLGLPSMFDQKKAEMFGFLLDKVLQKMKDFSGVVIPMNTTSIEKVGKSFRNQRNKEWVPFSDDFYIRSPFGLFHNRNTVSDFIEDGHWNVRMLCINIYGRIQSFIYITPSIRDVSSVFSVVAMTYWFIWRSRNNFVFENLTPSPHNTLESVYAQLNDYQKFVTHQSISALPYRPPTLIPPHTLLHSGYPHDSSVKLNCDDAFKNLSAAFGIVTCDSTGLLSYSLGNRWHDMFPLHAKIIAVHYACSLAFNHGCFNAIVESDSQIAISLSSLDMPLPWSLADLVDDIRLWAKEMYIRFSWVNRESNKVAHWVARNAFSSTVGFSWDVFFPDELTSLSRSD